MNPVWLHEQREKNLENFTELSSKLASLTFENRMLRMRIKELNFISQEHKHLNGLLRVENKELEKKLKEVQDD
jgi:hypothetical protein